MNDQQLLDNAKKLIDACLASGLVKSVNDAQGLLQFYQHLENRLKEKLNNS